MDYLKKVQEKEYEMLVLFDDFCKSNNLKYFLGGGTLLGAVRHNGFIPWDDDIDICMLREDYTKFLELWQDSDKYTLINYKTSKDYYLFHSKITYNNSKMYSRFVRDDVDFNLGVFIDIFPMDYVHDDYEQVLKDRHKLWIWWRILNMSSFSKVIALKDKKTPVIEYPLRFISWIIHKFVGRKRAIKNLEKKVMKYKYTNHFANYFTPYTMERDIYPTYLADNLIEHQFGNGKFPIYHDYDVALQIEYGPDYMEIPKNVAPNSHHDIQLLEIDGVTYIKNGEIL